MTVCSPVRFITARAQMKNAMGSMGGRLSIVFLEQRQQPARHVVLPITNSMRSILHFCALNFHFFQAEIELMMKKYIGR